MRFESDGWTEKDWNTLNATSVDLRVISSELDELIGCGGGSFSPAEVRELAKRLRVIVSQLEHVEKQYI